MPIGCQKAVFMSVVHGASQMGGLQPFSCGRMRQLFESSLPNMPVDRLLPSF
jgi:hypothetical protein